ncbi:hypothetical protein [Paractinoplanes maris]|uniref:hypothetical protein n=1 Tax=Paractinoplanes maris TaxID=1734446 RepID=UPI002021F3C7|nr:hypothetical protein [Actinoplanes maris]
MRVIKLAAGLAVGYVLGSRAGREKYEQIVATARKVQGSPTVTQAQQKAKAMLGTESESRPARTDPAPSPAPEASVTALPRPPRRQPKTTPAKPAASVDPLA